MNWVATTCISVYAVGLLVIPTAFGIYNSREIRHGHFDETDYLLFLFLLIIWPITLALGALCGIGYALGCAPYLVVKWWMEKCANLTENWKERKRQNEVEEQEK